MRKRVQRPTWCANAAASSSLMWMMLTGDRSVDGGHWQAQRCSLDAPLASDTIILGLIMPPPRRGGRGHPYGAGALSGDRRLSSVRLSVCLSDVAYIGSNSKTKTPRKTKLCTGVSLPQVTCDTHMHTDFKVKRSKVKVTGRGHIVAAT